MATHYIEEYATTAAFIANTPDVSDKIGIGSVGERLYINRGGAAVELIGFAAEVVTATKTLTAGENGKTVFLNSATEFVTTLPAPALGLKYRFIVAAAPSGASYTIVTNGSANIIKGAVYSADLNAASDGDIETSGGDTITLVDSKAVAGDVVEIESDGTNWFARIFVSAFDAATITTAS